MNLTAEGVKVSVRRREGKGVDDQAWCNSQSEGEGRTEECSKEPNV